MINKKIILPFLLSIIPYTAMADYQIKVYLDDSVKLAGPSAINGSASLNPNTINRGSFSTLSWSYDYANEVSIEGIGVYGKTGSIDVNPLASRNYVVTATYGSVSKVDNLSLTVIQPPSNITFTSNRSRIGIGQNVSLNWSVANASNIEIDNGVGNGLANTGSTTVYPTTDTTFTLTATDYSSNLSTQSLFIDVVNNSIINTFNASALNITTGQSVTFNWNVSDSEGLVLSPFGEVSGIPSGNQAINFNTAGFYDFTLKSMSLSGTEVSSTPIGINVYNPAIITSYTINGSSATLDVSANESLNFAWTASDAISYRLNGNVVNGNSTSLLASSSIGSTTYSLEALNGAGDSVNRSISVNVVGLPTISDFNSPTNVFTNTPFTLSWNGTGVSRYEMKSNAATSGIATTATDLGSSTSINATPTIAGSYTYTLSAYNTANAKVDSDKTVVVEADPIFTGFTVNGESNISVSPNTSLTFFGTGFSTGAALQGRNSSNTANEVLPSTAPNTSGNYTYYANATKSLNSITRYSSLRNVVVNVVNAPTIGTITAPTNVFANAAFNISWTGTNVTNYKIRGNVAASGVATTDVDLTTTTSRAITPTAAGTYTYTITATNAAGVTATSTSTVVVEADPTFTGFTVNSGTTATVAPSAVLTFLGTGFSTGATIQGRNSAGTANAALPNTASASAGSTTYYASATKSLNSITRYSALRSVSVTVAADPTIGTITAPTNVFVNSTFTSSWTGTNVTNYKIRGNVAASGVSTTDVDLGTNFSTNITPTAAGTYTYTITATNAAGVTTTSTSTVIVEADPIFTGFTVNGSTTATVAQSAALTFAGTGFSTGATIQGRNSAGTANAALPTTASSTAGATTYYASATKSLNSITRYSALRSVSVTVVAAPTIGTITAPTNVFANSDFNISWSGTNVTNYKIKGNVASSGISTTDVDLGTSTSTVINPTAAGTYTYTITATNAAGVTTTSTSTVVVEADPIFTGFTVNSSTTATVAPSAALTFAGTGFSSGATIQGRNSAGTANATLPTTASASAGATTYYASASKSLNSVTRYSALRSVSVTVVAAPTIGTITAPSAVFANAPFDMSWSGTNVTSWTIRGNSAASGVSTTDVTTSTSRSITPTAAGTYTYTITATNAAGTTTTSTSTVIVEADPTYTGLTANGVAVGTDTAMTLAPNAALNFVSSGLSTGSADILFVDGNLRGMAGTAPATAGTYSYVYTAFKNLNGVTRNGGNRTLTLTVSAPMPTITSFVATRESNRRPDCSYITGIYSYTYTNTTSLTIYYPSYPTGYAQTTTGKDVTGTTSHALSKSEDKYGDYNVRSTGWQWTLKACNGTNCVTKTLKTTGGDCMGSG